MYIILCIDPAGHPRMFPVVGLHSAQSAWDAYSKLGYKMTDPRP